MAAEVVRFKYSVRDSRGRLIDASGDKPMQILTGRGQVLAGVEQALIQMVSGQTAEVTLTSREAYGEYNDSLVVQVPSSRFQGTPKIGDRFKVKIEDGSSVEMAIADEKSGYFILDGNHPLAGIDLTFRLEILEKRPATAEELGGPESSSSAASI